MAIEKHMLHAQSTDDVTVLKDRIAELEKDNKRLENAVDVYKSNANVFKCKVAEMSMKLCESRKNHKATSRALWLARALALSRFDVEEYLRKYTHCDSRYWNDGLHTFNEACKLMQKAINTAEAICKAKAEEYK